MKIRKWMDKKKRCSGGEEALYIYLQKGCGLSVGRKSQWQWVVLYSIFTIPTDTFFILLSWPQAHTYNTTIIVQGSTLLIHPHIVLLYSLSCLGASLFNNKYSYIPIHSLLTSLSLTIFQCPHITSCLCV